ncbi:MarR family winged helix-turn-helix transcriptional regulator [Lutibacter sp. B1]|uniref:MarR family winged helix-turn-helix transcriptional regulator n=1 Tax=Lutibacter sp. B1 TaxID=2725996 RepID=UPI001456EF55|nr:MarR family transcriptional regulator [Lutibacter sp. B1]NLP57019.1 MarR family transcriptional regulator [Lutibacter sp. B1]
MKIQDEIKSKFKNEYLKARINLHFTHNYLNNQLIDVLKPFKVSPTQFNVLRILRGQYPNTSSIGLIKERMIDKNSDISRVVDRMHAKKLVIRKECKQDRRQKDIIITQLGLDFLAKIDELEDELDNKIRHLTTEEITQLNNLLDKIRS